LVAGVELDYLDEPVNLVNSRPSLNSRFSPVELGVHDGLANYPDDIADVAPAAIVALRDEELERSAAIDLVHVRTEGHLEVLVQARTNELELAQHRLEEAMYRLVTRHPRGSRAGLFATPEDAVAATAEARAGGEPSETPHAEEPVAEPASHESEPSSGKKRAAPPPAPVKPTLEQRVAASRELSWTIRPGWFWLGSALLFAAEFPFMKAVVRQLLLQRNPPEPLQYLATISITVGFLIGTKLTGLLLRRAQSMFLLASLIHPERRPMPVRLWRRLRKRSDPDDPPHVSDPTEQGLRFGAWSRLVGAFVLALILVGAVLAIAYYRSAAVRALRLQSLTGGDEFGTGTSGSDAGGDLLPLVSQGALQRVFIAVALLNVVCAIALAWASTDVPYEFLPADGESAGEADADSEFEIAAGVIDHGTSSRRRRRERRKERRKQLGGQLEHEVERHREDVIAARTRLAEAESRLRRAEQDNEAVKRLSAAQCQLDERTYWWANRASRKFVMDPDVDRRLAETRGTTPPPPDGTRVGAGR
jgi:hypothetical protein